MVKDFRGIINESNEFNQRKQKGEFAPGLEYTFEDAASKNMALKRSGIQMDILRKTDSAAVGYGVIDGKKSLVVFEKSSKLNEKTGKMEEVWSATQQVALTDDTRVSWDRQGKAQILTGAAATRSGVLRAGGDNEILVLVKAGEAELGKNTTVFNFSERENVRFSGGANVTFRGSYLNSAFENLSGTTNFAGYFESGVIGSEKDAGSSVFSGYFQNMTLNGGSAADVFSGMFEGVQALGNAGADIFSGLFIAGSLADGGEGDDAFKGVFQDSQARGGAGNDTYGSGVRPGSALKTADGHKLILADFDNATIEDADGDNSFNGTANHAGITFGDGDNRVSGALAGSAVSTGAGRDVVNLLFSDNSNIDAGDGDNSIAVNAAKDSAITAGSGRNAMTLGGAVGNLSTGDRWLADDFLADGASLGKPKELAEKALSAGEIQNTTVDATRGDTLVTFHDGREAHRVYSNEDMKQPVVAHGGLGMQHAVGDRSGKQSVAEHDRDAASDADATDAERDPLYQKGLTVQTAGGDVTLDSVSRRRARALQQYRARRAPGLRMRVVNTDRG
jgi:hypothetical protein